jgi:bifunctional DNA-binding transcriptional regulator/antitoxin component of YhaV-PrlF toxin-antitoxin module
MRLGPWHDQVMARRRTSGEMRMGQQGRIVVPAELCARLGFSEGARLIARVEDGELRISTYRANLERARRVVRARVPAGVSLVEELLAERRRDAACEATD